MKTRAAGVLMLVAGVLAMCVGLFDRPAGAAGGTLLGQGEEWPVPLMQQLVVKGGGQTAPFTPVYQGTIGEQVSADDVATGKAVFAITGGAASSATLADAKKNGLTLGYAPYTAGAVAIIASVPSCGQVSLNLSVTTLVQIFTGGVSSWASPAITSANPTLQGCIAQIPNQNTGITRVVSILPESTTAAMISLFLSDPVAKPLWDAYVVAHGGAKDTVYDVWPDDRDLRQLNAGDKDMIDKVLSNGTSGGITYAAPAWATAEGVLVSALQNTAQGQANATNYVLPTSAAVAKALTAAASLDTTTNLVNVDPSKVTDPAAYPLPMFEYLVVPVAGLRTTPPSGTTQDSASALSAFMAYILGPSGQQDILNNGYVPLPANIDAASLQVAQTVGNQASTGTAAATTTTSTTVAGATTTTTTAGATTTTLAGATTTTVSGATTTTLSGATTTTVHGATTTTIAAINTAGTHGATGGSSNGGGGTASIASGVDPSASLPFTGWSQWLWLVGGAVLIVGSQLGRRWAGRRRHG
jgi:ABC-type phosphate transport system substrate-binding protein